MASSYKYTVVSVLLAAVVLSASPSEAILDEISKLVQSWLAPSKTYVVVIGINSYQRTRSLNYAVNDARRVVSLFESMGFVVDHVLLREKPDDQHVTKAVLIESVRAALAAARPQDRVFVFYAGHGREIKYVTGDTEAFLLPSDADPDDLIKSALAFRDLLRLARLPEVKAHQVLFILDACYAADALSLESGRETGAHDPLDSAYYKRLLEGRFIGAVTAGNRNQQVREVDGHGVFTEILIRGLAGEADQDGNGLIAFDDLVVWLRPKVFTASGPYEQEVKDGRLGTSIGQPVFVVPSETVRRKLFTEAEADRISAQHAERRKRLAQSRGLAKEGTDGTQAPLPSLSPAKPRDGLANDIADYRAFKALDGTCFAVNLTSNTYHEMEYLTFRCSGLIRVDKNIHFEGVFENTDVYDGIFARDVPGIFGARKDYRFFHRVLISNNIALYGCKVIPDGRGLRCIAVWGEGFKTHDIDEFVPAELSMGARDDQAKRILRCYLAVPLARLPDVWREASALGLFRDSTSLDRMTKWYEAATADGASADVRESNLFKANREYALEIAVSVGNEPTRLGQVAKHRETVCAIASKP